MRIRMSVWFFFRVGLSTPCLSMSPGRFRFGFPYPKGIILLRQGLYALLFAFFAQRRVAFPPSVLKAAMKVFVLVLFLGPNPKSTFTPARAWRFVPRTSCRDRAGPYPVSHAPLFVRGRLRLADLTVRPLMLLRGTRNPLLLCFRSFAFRTAVLAW